jgi:phage tail tape-measure protein
VFSSHGVTLLASGSQGGPVVDDHEKEEVGKITGSVAGALGGARLAMTVFPVPVVGPFAGAVVGGVVGSEIGRRLSKAVFNGAAAFVETMREDTPATGTDTAETVPAAHPTSGETTGVHLTPVVTPRATTDEHDETPT